MYWLKIQLLLSEREIKDLNRYVEKRMVNCIVNLR